MSNDNIVFPHDRFFRLIVPDPKVIKEFLGQYLPENIRKIIDFDTIKPQKDSFIGDDLKQQLADLLFTADFNGSSGYIYILVEHQSVSYEFMPFRILKYMVAIMEQHLQKTKDAKLPIVYPIIFYSGKYGYSYSTDIFDLFGDDKELARDILWQPYQLIDLSKISDEELKKNLLYGVLARVMKHAHEREVEKTMSRQSRNVRFWAKLKCPLLLKDRSLHLAKN